jgi:hypothetical protein
VGIDVMGVYAGAITTGCAEQRQSALNAVSNVIIDSALAKRIEL